MAFHRLSPEQPLESQLVSGSFGVAEPLETLPVILPDAGQAPLCLVSGLAFDQNGGRLGYGAGISLFAKNRLCAVLFCDGLRANRTDRPASGRYRYGNISGGMEWITKTLTVTSC